MTTIHDDRIPVVLRRWVIRSGDTRVILDESDLSGTTIIEAAERLRSMTIDEEITFGFGATVRRER